jgi:hypothetical protein
MHFFTVKKVFRPGIRMQNSVIRIPRHSFEATKRLILNTTTQNCSTIFKTISAFAKSTDLLFLNVFFTVDPGYTKWRGSVLQVGFIHRVDVLCFFSSRPNCDSPTPSHAGECAPPPLLFRGRDTLACGRGGKGSPIRTRGQTLWYSRCMFFVASSQLFLAEHSQGNSFWT